MSASKNTIFVWTQNQVREMAIASGAMKPGMAVQRTNATADTVVVHATVNVRPKPLFVLEEDELQGKEITDAYASGDKVIMRVAQPGDLVMALVAQGEVLAKSDYLTLGADGLWYKVDSSEEKVAQAREAKDLSVSAVTDNEHVLVQIV